jgi:hypothetical protein
MTMVMASDDNPVVVFLRERMNVRTIRPQTAIAVLMSVAFAGDVFAVYAGTWGTEARAVYGGTVLILTMFALLVPLVGWVLLTLAVVFAGRFIGTRIRYNVLFRAMGWANLPLVAAFGFVAYGRYRAIETLDYCGREILACDVTEFRGIIEQTQEIFAVMDAATALPEFRLFFGAGVLAYLLAAVLWAFATYNSSRLTVPGATLAAGVPSLLVLGLYAYLVF